MYAISNTISSVPLAGGFFSFLGTEIDTLSSMVTLSGTSGTSKIQYIYI